MALDTLAYSKKLQEAGFTARQAEVQAEALHMVLEHDIATKQDLRELEARLETKMAQMEARLEARMAQVEAKITEMEIRLLVRPGAIMIGGITILGVLIALVK
jgi:hypothetical protein